MKTIAVMFDVAGSVIVDKLSSATTFASQYHPDGHLLTFFPNADGVLSTQNGGDTVVENITTTRHGRVYRTIQTTEGGTS